MHQMYPSPSLHCLVFPNARAKLRPHHHHHHLTPSLHQNELCLCRYGKFTVGSPTVIATIHPLLRPTGASYYGSQWTAGSGNRGRP
jgi:hypothetical protein